MPPTGGEATLVSGPFWCPRLWWNSSSMWMYILAAGCSLGDVLRLWCLGGHTDMSNLHCYQRPWFWCSWRPSWCLLSMLPPRPCGCLWSVLQPEVTLMPVCPTADGSHIDLIVLQCHLRLYQHDYVHGRGYLSGPCLGLWSYCRQGPLGPWSGLQLTVKSKEPTFAVISMTTGAKLKEGQGRVLWQCLPQLPPPKITME